MMRGQKQEFIHKDGSRDIVWYDASDLTVQPDNSENAQNAFDAGQLESDVYLEAMGFDGDARPKVGPEMRETILVKSAMSGTPLADSYFILFPEDKPSPEEAALDANAAKGIDPAQAEASTCSRRRWRRRSTRPCVPWLQRPLERF
jgi:hypothetical protein